MSDIRADWHLLEVLRKTTLADVPDAHWEIICKQVVEVDGIRNLSGQARQIVFDGVEKAKSFGGDRSAAGRYAANMRWATQGAGSPPNKPPKNPGRIAANARWKKLKEQEKSKKETSEERGDKKRYSDTLADIRRKRKEWERALLEAPEDSQAAYNAKGVLERLDRAEEQAKAGLARAEAELASQRSANTAGAAADGPDRRTARAISDPSLSSLASAIRADLRAQGKKVPYSAAPYLDALESLDSIKDKFYEDSASSVVAYLLSNLSTYKGPNAKAIKAELKRRLKEGDPSPKSETTEDKKGGRLFPVMPAPTKGSTEAARGSTEGDVKVIGRGKKGPSKPIGRAPSKPASPDDYKLMSERSADQKGKPKTDPKSMADRLDDPKYDGNWTKLPAPNWYPDRGDGRGVPKWVVDPDMNNRVKAPKGANKREWMKTPEGKKAVSRARKEHFKRMESDPIYRREYLLDEEFAYESYYNP